jgi:hypothetical protein
MSLVAKISPVGIDTTINDVQQGLYDYLTTIGLWSSYESYHRAYKNPLGENTIPEAYIGNNEYKEILFDDKFNATSFFLISDNSPATGDDNVFTQTVSIIYQCKLDKLYPVIDHRADAEMQDDVLKAFNEIDYNVTNIIIGVDNVYSDLDLRTRLKEEVGLTDISNFHVVRFDFEVQYIYDCKYSEL